MSYNKLAILVNKLADKTTDHKINWEETARGDSFQVSFPEYSIIIDTCESETESGQIDYRIAILNNEGRIIESAVDPDFKDYIEDPYLIMKDMYETARRQTLGVEDALDSILEKLDEDDIPF